MIKEFLNEKREYHRTDGPAIENIHGKFWYKNGKLHRLDGPAVEWTNGGKEWYIEGKKYTENSFTYKILEMNNPSIDYAGNKFWKNEKGEFHRKNYPACEFYCGTKKWYKNGKLHREDGPANEWSNGTKEWWINGKRHRIDGPAIECENGYKEWWVNGKKCLKINTENTIVINNETFLQTEILQEGYNDYE